VSKFYDYSTALVARFAIGFYKLVQDVSGFSPEKADDARWSN
jgi:hypothetical protein